MDYVPDPKILNVARKRHVLLHQDQGHACKLHSVRRKEAHLCLDIAVVLPTSSVALRKIPHVPMKQLALLEGMKAHVWLFLRDAALASLPPAFAPVPPILNAVLNPPALHHLELAHVCKLRFALLKVAPLSQDIAWVRQIYNAAFRVVEILG